MHNVPATPRRWIAILGQRDHPTDALRDYCELLAEALEKRDCLLKLVSVDWTHDGWRNGLKLLSGQVRNERADWALVQYTHLSWSRHGFSFKFPQLIRQLRRSGSNVLIVFHDPTPFPGNRIRDRLRRRVQLSAMRKSATLAHKIVSTIPSERVPWMSNSALRAKTLSIPVGSNVSAVACSHAKQKNNVPAVIVFGVSEVHTETALTASVLSQAAKECGPLRLIVFGRGAEAAEILLRRRLSDSAIEVQVFGVLPREDSGALLAASDVQLFVRSGVSARRGSAIAGIACGLPIVGFSNHETGFPVTEAGVRLVPVGDRDGLVRELISVLRDEALRETLRQQSLEAAHQYFSWERIAEQYLLAVR